MLRLGKGVAVVGCMLRLTPNEVQYVLPHQQPHSAIPAKQPAPGDGPRRRAFSEIQFSVGGHNSRRSRLVWRPANQHRLRAPADAGSGSCPSPSQAFPAPVREMLPT
ncbi:hypothetical protein V2G26_011535 [Clonostachys chloroleuca]